MPPRRKRSKLETVRQQRLRRSAVVVLPQGTVDDLEDDDLEESYSPPTMPW